MAFPPIHRIAAAAGTLLLVVALAACGGGPATSTPPTTAPATPTAAPSAAATVVPPASASAGSAAILGTIEVGSGPCALESSPDGRVFVTLYGTGDVVEVHPETGNVTPVASLGATICGLAWSNDALWVADLSGNLVHEVALDTGKDIHDTALAGKPWDAQPDATGVWIPDRGLPGVVHIDGVTGAIDRSVMTGLNPAGLAVVDDQLWVAVQGAGEVDRLNETGDEIDVRVTSGLGVSPTWFADGDGTLWVTDNGGAVARIDPATGSVLASIPLGGTPRDPVYAFGALWVANAADGILYRIDPATNAVSGTAALAPGIWTVEQVGREIWVEEYSGNRIFRIDPTLVE